MMTTSSGANKQQAVSARHAVLEELIGIASAELVRQAPELCTRLAAVLIDASLADAASMALRLRCGLRLRDGGAAFQSLAAQVFQRTLRLEIAQLAPLPGPAARAGGLTMSLVPYEEMDSKVVLAGLGRPFELCHAEQLQTLNVRLASLFERDTLRDSQNPFRPEVFLRAIQQAWEEFHADAEAAALLPPLLKPELFLALGGLYESLALALQRNGVRPGAARGRNEPARPRPRSQPAELSQQLRQFFAARVDSGEFDPPALGAAPAGQQPLMGYLSGLQQHLAPAALATVAAADAAPGPASAKVFYLPALKERLPQGSLSRHDESTIDLLSAVFSAVFGDQNIAQEIRDLMRVLQIPVLKAALLDQQFFFQETHPARRLIELLASAGWEQRRGPDDPLFRAMQNSVERVGRAGEQETPAFAAAVAELEQSIEAEESAAARAMAEPIAAALRQERLAEAGRAAQAAVAERIAGGEAIALVAAFLERRWVKVLTVAHQVEADKPGAVAHACRTMDELIWSAQPKLEQAQRKRLIARLPALLATLNQWLDIIKWQDAERLQFFAELAECHASIVRAPLELSPERRLELATQAARQAAERRQQWQSRAAQEGGPDGAGPQDEAQRAVDALERGMWLEFSQPDGATRKLKLAWVSPLRTLYIFATASRQEGFSSTAQQLAGQLRDGLARICRSDDVVALALSQAMAQTGDQRQSQRACA